MIQKFFENFFFAFLESTYFNSRKNAIKKFSVDFPLYDGLGLRKIFKHFWVFFFAFSCQPLEIFRRNLDKREKKWIQSRRKRQEAIRSSHFVDIQPQSRQKSTKIDQNLWMIQKFFEKNFLAKTILNAPIRKVIIVKVKFEDLRNFFYYQVNQARHLESFW